MDRAGRCWTKMHCQKAAFLLKHLRLVGWAMMWLNHVISSITGMPTLTTQRKGLVAVEGRVGGIVAAAAAGASAAGSVSSRSSGIVSACFSSRWTWNRIFMIFMDFRGTVHSLSVKGNEKQESFWEPFAQHHPTHDPIYSNIINIHQYQNLKWTWPRKWPSSAKVLELHIDEIDIARCSKPSASLHTLNSLIVLCWAHFWHRQRPTRWFSVILLAAYALRQTSCFLRL